MELNSHLGNLINLPIQFLALLLGFIYIKNIKLSKKDIWIICIYLFIPTIILYLITYWAGIIYLFISLTTFFYNHRKNFYTFFYISALFVISILLDHLSTLFVFNIKSEAEILPLILRISTFIILFVLLMPSFKIIDNFFQNKIQLSLNIQILLVSITLVTLIVFYFNIFRSWKHSDLEILKLNMLIFVVYLFLIFTLILLLLHIVLKEQKISAREKEYENFSSYVVSLEQANEDMQKFRHDYLNVLLSIGGYIEARDWDELETYFEGKILNFEKKTLVSNEILGNLKNLQIKGLKGLLFTKCSRAIENDLNISIEISQPIAHIAMDIIDLNRVLGILIDNAFENCIEEARKDIQIAFIQEVQGSTMIVIRNRIKENDVKIKQLFEEGYTTKTYGHGMGLAIVKKIIDSNPNTTLNIWIDQDWFNVELIIMEG